MATLDSTPVRELSDMELRKRLLQLGYDVPVSVNREFLVRKLENASSVAGGGGGGGSKSKKRHSMAAAPSPTSQASGSPSTVRKRKSMAATPNAKNSASGHSYQNNAGLSTPQQQYMGSPASTMSMGTPSTPSPIVSRLNSPSSNTPHGLNNGEPPSHHTPRYMNYYNMFKTTPSGSDGSGGSGDMGGGGGGGGYGYQYNRGISRMSAPGSFNPVTSVAPPSRSSDRNGYSTGGASSASLGVESDWFGGHVVPKMLVLLFVFFFVIIGGFYVSIKMGPVDPRGLTGSVESEGSKSREAQPPPVPPPPAKKKIDLPPPTSMRFPVCGLKDVDPEACISKDVVKNSRSLFNMLKEELTLRARKKGCQDVQEIVSLKEAKSILYNLIDLKKTDVDAAFEGMLLLVTENPRSGLSLHGKDEEQEISSKVVSSLDYTLTKISATGVNPDFLCGVTSFVTSASLYLAFLVATGGAVYLSWKGYTIYKARKQAQEEEIFGMVEKVLEILYQQYEVSQNSQGPSFLAVNHVRDELIPPIERLKKEAFWNKVVNYISNHESRIREEIQHFSGEEFKVWRWLPSASPLASKRFSSTANSHHHQSRNRFSMPVAPPMTSSPVVPSTSAAVAGPSHASMPPPPSQNNLYPSLSSMANCSDDDEGLLNGSGDANCNNKWQGQAFETCEGSPNALPSTPTTCLKIRHMFTDKDGIKERVRIEKNILEKCCQAKILHIGIDPTSVEGCVYVRCLSKEDAGKAFQALHGWWFDGHLLSVKFLREERYFSRFPDAKHATLPMGLPR